MSPMKAPMPARVVFTLVVVLWCGCVTPSKPEPSYVSAEFPLANIRQLAVLPLIDARLDRSQKVNQRKMSAGIKKFTRSPLRKRGYEPIYLRDFEVPSVPSGLLEHPDPELLKAICPPGHRYCLLFLIEDISQRNHFFSAETGTILAMGVVDGTTGTVLYHDMDVKRQTGSGTVGLLMKGTTQYNSVMFSAEALVKKLPSRGG